MNYRDRLYRQYSPGFGELKRFNPEVQWRLYDSCYASLPGSKQAAILDVGCGRGEWLGWMKNRGFENLTGFEISSAEATTARQHYSLKIVEGDAVESLQAFKESFDLIHAKDLVEHLTKNELMQFLGAALEALKPGGELWILTYNAQAPFASAIRYGDFTHEIGLTPTSMLQVLRTAGFELKSIKGIHHTGHTAKGMIRRLLWAAGTRLFRLLLLTRYGAQPAQSVDTLACEPDLFAIGIRPGAK